MFHIGYIHTCGLLLHTGEGHHHRILRLRWVGLRPPGCRPSQLQGTEEEIQEIQGVRPEIHKETSTWQKLGLQAFFGPKWCHSLKLTPETTSQQLISYSNNLAKYGAPPWGQVWKIWAASCWPTKIINGSGMMEKWRCYEATKNAGELEIRCIYIYIYIHIYSINH